MIEIAAIVALVGVCLAGCVAQGMITEA